MATNTYVALDKVTVGTATTTITFTGINQGYTDLVLIYQGATAAAANMFVRVGNVSLDTGSNYSWHLLFGNGSSAGSSSGVSSTAMQAQRMPANTSTAGLFGAVVADVLDYANTNKNKTVRTLAAFDDNAGGYGSIFRLTSGLWMDTDAVTSIQMTMNVGNIAEHSHFALYGIKGA